MNDHDLLHAAARDRLNTLHREAAQRRLARRAAQPYRLRFRLHLPFTRWTLALSLRVA